LAITTYDIFVCSSQVENLEVQRRTRSSAACSGETEPRSCRRHLAPPPPADRRAQLHRRFSAERGFEVPADPFLPAGIG
jgi:hypothetical protein